jgi:DNA-binding protein YbaB
VLDKFKKLGELKKLRSQALQMQRELAAEQIEVEEGGIRVVVTGDQKIQSIKINNEEQKSLVGVLNKAIQKAQQKAAAKLSQMSGGLTGLLGK